MKKNTIFTIIKKAPIDKVLSVILIICLFGLIIYRLGIYYSETILFVSLGHFFLIISAIIICYKTFKNRANLFENNQKNNKYAWLYPLGLITLTILGFIIRVYNLDFLDATRDELLHLVGAKRFLLEGTFNYSRASFLTYIVGYLFKAVGHTSLYLARIPSVIFGTLSIVTIYFLGKCLNKKIGLIAAYLVAFSPIAIGLSRNIREYSAYFLFFTLFLLLLIYLIKKIDRTKNWNRKKIVTNIIISLPLLFPAIYYILVEHIHAVYLLYGVICIFIFIFLLFKFLNAKNKKILLKNKKILLTILLMSILIIYILTNFLSNYGWLINNDTSTNGDQNYYGQLFLTDWGYRNNSLTINWFSGSIFSSLFIIFLFILPLSKFYRNKYFISFYLSFGLILISFIFLVDRYFAPRYIFYNYIFYIFIFACSIYLLINLTKIFPSNFQKILYFIPLVIILFSFFSPLTALNSVLDEKNGQIDKKTDLIHRDTDELFNLIEDNNFKTEDILISANYDLFAYYYDYEFIDNPEIYPLQTFAYDNEGKLLYDYTKIYNYAYKREDRSKNLDEIIRNSQTGWIIIDRDRNQNWNQELALNNQIRADKLVVYLGSTSGLRGFDVYKWY